jgi:hypothetical protein
VRITIYRHTPNIEGDRNNIGDLHIDGEFFCYTLEDEIRPDGEKVYGKTAIQSGTYDVILTMSNRFKRLMPLVLDVPMFKGIRLHGGNTAKDSHGCPLVAFNTDYKKIWGTAERKLTAKIAEAIDNGESVTLQINNSWLSYDKENHIDSL